MKQEKIQWLQEEIANLEGEALIRRYTGDGKNQLQ
jgi:hypothetical protein